LRIQLISFTFWSILQKENQILSTKTGFSEQRHQRAFWYIAVVLWYNGAALPASMVVDEVAPDA
jgi:hypothetical protein